jgi:hypothetical protein
MSAVSELLNAEGSDWDYNKIVAVFNNADAEAITKIKLSGRRSEDVLAWHMEKSGVFSASGAHRLGLDIQNSPQASASSSALAGDRALWKGLWSLAVPPKIRMFAWKLSKHILPTKKNKHIRRMDMDACCSLCGNAPETASTPWLNARRPGPCVRL